jgi:site-specific recombinase XerD
METADLTTTADASTRILKAALSGLSPNTCRVYRRHLTQFLNRVTSLTRETVQGYMGTLDDTASYNQCLSAIKRLASQSAANGWISYETANQIDSIPTKTVRGHRSGHWLAQQEARALVSAPDSSTLVGKRDRAVLALLVGCGIRRDELARLTVAQFLSRSGRWYLANVVGKGNRIRSIAVPEWAVAILLDWVNSLGKQAPDSRLIRSFGSVGEINGSISASAIWDIVLRYSKQTGVTCTPHDLRRTYGKLARLGGAAIETIQHSLGHSDIKTTMLYLATGEESNAGDFFTL